MPNIPVVPGPSTTRAPAERSISSISPTGSGALEATCSTSGVPRPLVVWVA